MSCKLLENYYIKKAVKVIKSGKVIIYPTEAVFGIGCDPNNEQSLKKILEIKQRDYKKGLIIVASDFTQILDYIDIELVPKDIFNKLKQSWPLHTTYIFPAHKSLSRYLIGENNDTIAIRVSSNTYIKKICDLLGHPIVSTSANLSGHNNIIDYKQAKKIFKNKGVYIVPGIVDINLKPSKIVDVFNSKVLR
tara:strand:- start:11298 stop:11873 length:576 start_codon:yes stop_codon:yes gene_type:complete